MVGWTRCLILRARIFPWGSKSRCDSPFYNILFFCTLTCLYRESLVLDFCDRPLVFFSQGRTPDTASDFVCLEALSLPQRTVQVRSVCRGGGGGCVSALVTGPSGLPPGWAVTWTLPPQRPSTSQTHLASLAGPAVTVQPEPMIHSVGVISWACCTQQKHAASHPGSQH